MEIFSSTAGRIDYEMGDSHSAGMSLQFSNNVHAGFNRRAEMIGAFGEISLVQIVRFDACQQKLMHQPLHDVWIVIDTFKKHGLRTQRHPGIRQHAAGGLDRGCEFVGVIEMKIHVNGMILFDHLAQFWSNPFRERTGDARADSNQFQMRDRAQRLKDPFE